MNRDKTYLTDDTAQKCYALVTMVKEEFWYDIFLTDWHRTDEEQDKLYEQGRTTPGNVVTWTRDSTHEYGIAFDIAFRGAELYPKEHQKRANVASVGKKIWLLRGFCKRGADRPHFENNGVPLSRYVTPRIELSDEHNAELDELIKDLGRTFDNCPDWEIQKACHDLANLLRERRGY